MGLDDQQRFEELSDELDRVWKELNDLVSRIGLNNPEARALLAKAEELLAAVKEMAGVP